MTSTALLLIDIQNDYFPDFAGCKMPLPGMVSATKNAALLLADARQNHWPVFHVRHIMGSRAAPFFHPETNGAEIHDSVTPLPTERIIDKTRPNSFIGTELEQKLRDLNITELTICGAMSQMCIDASVRAAVDSGFKVTVAHDACAAACVVHDGVEVPAEKVHASIMAPLSASYATVQTTLKCL